MIAPVISLTSFTIDPKQPAGEIRAEAGPGTPRSGTRDLPPGGGPAVNGFVDELDANVLRGAAELLGQAEAMFASLDEPARAARARG